MNKEDESYLFNWLKDKDVSEVMDLLMRNGNRYSRRILKFFSLVLQIRSDNYYVLPRLWDVEFLAESP